MKKKLFLFILIVAVCVLAFGIKLNFTHYEGLDVQEKQTTTPNKNIVFASKMKDGGMGDRSLDVKFHDNIEDIIEQTNAYVPPKEKIIVKDKKGKALEVNISNTLGGFTYYKPGTYKYGGTSYVPSYEDSIILSSRAGLVPKRDLKNAEIYVNDGGNDNQEQKLKDLSVKFEQEKIANVLANEKLRKDLEDKQKNIANSVTEAKLNVQTKIKKTTTTPVPVTLDQKAIKDVIANMAELKAIAASAKK
jgi:hypothetical protein